MVHPAALTDPAPLTMLRWRRSVPLSTDASKRF